jgi:NAD(P)-dependent dehydrogenase (short-subunit alcohol dehydrogenase family)
MVRGVVPMMKARGGGSILNITAISAIQPIPGFALSVATWSGVIGYAKTLSLEVAPHGINVNTICPGYIGTEINAAHFDSEQGQKLIGMLPRRRLGQPQDLDGLLLLLAVDESHFINGAIMTADDGASAQ